jgi:hypothetical protein
METLRFGLLPDYLFDELHDIGIAPNFAALEANH